MELKEKNVPKWINPKYFTDVSHELFKNLIEFHQNHPLQYHKYKDRELEYIDSGEGDSLMLIFHGAGGNAQIVYELIEEYEKKYRVIAPSIKTEGKYLQMVQGV